LPGKHRTQDCGGQVVMFVLITDSSTNHTYTCRTRTLYTQKQQLKSGMCDNDTSQKLFYAQKTSKCIVTLSLSV